VAKKGKGNKTAAAKKGEDYEERNTDPWSK
jgi:hypothetical protein